MKPRPCNDRCPLVAALSHTACLALPLAHWVDRHKRPGPNSRPVAVLRGLSSEGGSGGSDRYAIAELFSVMRGGGTEVVSPKTRR